MIENSLHDYLIADPALTAVIGTRVYPVTYPQGAIMPLVVYQKVGNAPVYAHNGAVGISEAIFFISSFADSYGQAHDVAWKVRQAFKPLEIAPGQMGDVFVASVFIDGELDVFGPMEFEPASKWHLQANYTIQVEEQ